MLQTAIPLIARYTMACLFVLFSHNTYASPLLTGQTVDVTFSESGFADEVDSGVLAVNPDIELSYLDGSNIGDTIMLGGESINFTDNTIVFTIRGDGANHSTVGGVLYQTTGFSPGASYVLDNFDYTIGSVNLSLVDNAIGVNLGAQILYDATSITFDISTMGIGTISGAPDLATIMLEVSFIPVPAALPLMLTGVAGLALFGRRKKQA